jgi:hypothetical protein
MKGQTDSLISVYNGDGYKAAMGFDKQFALNYELAIPLSVLGLSDGATFNYKIAINRINFDDTAVQPGFARWPRGNYSKYAYEYL